MRPICILRTNRIQAVELPNESVVALFRRRIYLAALIYVSSTRHESPTRHVAPHSTQDGRVGQQDAAFRHSFFVLEKTSRLTLKTHNEWPGKIDRLG